MAPARSFRFLKSNEIELKEARVYCGSIRVGLAGDMILVSAKFDSKLELEKMTADTKQRVVACLEEVIRRLKSTN